jgi:hypothetical protein
LYPEIDVQLDFTAEHTGQRRTQGFTTGTEGKYPGYDGFGRVLRQTWVDGGFTVHGTSSAVPLIPPILEEIYTYDQANRRSRRDGRPGASWSDRDFEYDYDDLDRLTDARRGVVGGGFTPGPGGQQWVLDMLGNWDQVKTDASGDGTFSTAESEGRTHNAANELTIVSQNGGSGPHSGLTWDDAGNVKVEGFLKHYVHDAWNRLVKVHYPMSIPELVSGEYEYYGLHWRSLKRAEVSEARDPANPVHQHRVFYYNASWQVVEERIDDNPAANDGDERIAELYWGARYIDDPVMRRVLDLAAGDLDWAHYYHITDAQFSTRALLGWGGMVVERNTFSAYGLARHHRRGDVNGDGAVDAGDTALIDLNRPELYWAAGT